MDGSVVEAVARALRAGGDAELCLLVGTRGSAPRKPGACLVLAGEGSAAGTVGGGALERLVLKEASALRAERASAVRSYTMDGAGSDTGMICGGDATVCYLHLGPAGRGAWEALERSRAERGRSWLAVRLVASAPEAVLLIEEAPATGAAAPLRAHALTGALGAEGLVTPGLEEKILACEEPHRAGDAFILPCAPEGRAIICGAGHVGAALAPVLAGIGFDVLVFDERPGLARAELVPAAAEVVCAPFAELSARVGITPRDYVVSCTPQHGSDLAVVRQALAARARFVGCLGSAKKAAFIRGRLAERGLSEEDIARLRMPVGIPLGDETPAEIAISIAAEIITVRRGFRCAPATG